MKNIRIFYLKIFIVWVVKFSVYLNRYVFEMDFDYILQCWEPVLSEKSSSRGKPGNATCCEQTQLVYGE